MPKNSKRMVFLLLFASCVSDAQDSSALRICWDTDIAISGSTSCSLGSLAYNKMADTLKVLGTTYAVNDGKKGDIRLWEIDNNGVIKNTILIDSQADGNSFLNNLSIRGLVTGS